MATPNPRRTGVLIGGSGLIGGTLLHHFKQLGGAEVELLAPNSKELSLRVPDDIRAYFERVKPDFVVNAAIASIDSNPQLTYEVTVRGALHLARACRELGIPYIHLSSAAVLPPGRDLSERDRLALRPELPNYAKAKLMVEHALEHMAGLDYTAIRLAVVYGAHDHKIQGFHRLLFSLVDRAMPVLVTTRDAVHSYTNARKLPAFVAHVLAHRDEFSRRTFHFVDPEPVPLGRLILAVRDQLGERWPRELYLPRALARFLVGMLSWVVRLATRIGLEARVPAESVFLDSFYRSQTLSTRALRASSFVDPEPDTTIFTELPALIAYYVQRWERLNLIAPRGAGARDADDRGHAFLHAPRQLLDAVIAEQDEPFLRRCALPGGGAGEAGPGPLPGPAARGHPVPHAFRSVAAGARAAARARSQ